MGFEFDGEAEWDGASGFEREGVSVFEFGGPFDVDAVESEGPGFLVDGPIEDFARGGVGPDGVVREIADEPGVGFVFEFGLPGGEVTTARVMGGGHDVWGCRGG